MKVWATMLWLESSTRDYSASGAPTQPEGFPQLTNLDFLQRIRRISPAHKFGFSPKTVWTCLAIKGIFVNMSHTNIQHNFQRGIWAFICWVGGCEWPRVATQLKRNTIMPSRMVAHHSIHTYWHQNAPPHVQNAQYLCKYEANNMLINTILLWSPCIKPGSIWCLDVFIHSWKHFVSSVSDHV